MSANRTCANCWYRIRLASGSYTGAVVDRCWHWHGFGVKWAVDTGSWPFPSATGEVVFKTDCPSWQPMSEDEEARRIAHFNLSYTDWLAEQRKALEVVRR